MVGAGTTHRPAPRRRWWFFGAVLLLTAALVVVLVVERTSEKRPPSVSQLGLPEQLLLTSPMNREPIAGWTVTARELDLPAGTFVRPIGTVGSKARFLGVTNEGWWVVGIDVASGHRLFAPVRLGASDDALNFGCFVNGPTMVLCVRQDRDTAKPTRTWVVNTANGMLSFDGPTDLQLPPTVNHPALYQVGNYVVAAVAGEGIHGVGAHGELTWFVPGSGQLNQSGGWHRDGGPQTLAVQSGQGTSGGDAVSSVESGHAVTPPVPTGERGGQAVAYPGGFGYEYRGAGGTLPRVAFFDDSGKELGRPDVAGTLRTGSLDLPMVETASDDVVYSLRARKLVEMPASVRNPSARLIGPRLFVSSDESQRWWQQYDLRTSSKGPLCDIQDLGFGYIGSDGAVAITLGSATPAQAVDLSTCRTLWALTGSTASMSKQVWRVDTALLERTNDELSSLVAPR